MNGETNVAPALAASMHCMELKQSVTLTPIPSAINCRVAMRPSPLIGSLTTMLSASRANSFPSATIASVSTDTTSALTGPSTSEQISCMMSRGSRSPATLASSEGLVVMPSISPACDAQRISPRWAVSRKNFMPRLPPTDVDNVPKRNRVPAAAPADSPPGCPAR